MFRVRLDADLLSTLVSIYPEWFPAEEQQAMEPASSPPKAEVDESPLHQAMDRNKESLKVKLMLRRPITQLVAQGIMPPLKTPPGFHEQRQKLERAKMGDLLRAKIQQRPDREELVRQHILEDVGDVDPSLAEKQRQLKKCRLADALNDQLSHRPGPLELIKKNILHTDEPIERAVKEGAIEFKATCEGTATKPTHPDHYMLDEDSSSLSPPPQAEIVAASPAPIVTVLLAPMTLPSPVYQVRQHQPQLPSVIKTQVQRKKSKVKTAPKARTIKFHEYKGPPNALKISPQSSSVETSYELLLQQQQLFLQWQLEWQHKYPQILLPASQKPPTPSSSASPSSSATSEVSQSSVPPPPPPLPQSPPPLRNLEDMKVSDLKAELKRRNLPVSGAKPQLIERLKPFSESHQLSIHQQTEDSLPSVCSVSSSGAGVSSTTCGSSVLMETEGPESPCSPASIEPTSSEDIIREQQRKIDQLQRQLTLHLNNNTFQVQQQSPAAQQPTTNAKASLAAFLQQQQLNQQAQLQQQQQQQQQQIIINNNNNIITKQEPDSPPHRSGSLPTFIGTFMNNSNELIPLSNDNSFIMDNKLLFETKPMDTSRQVDELMDVKSEIVDDVLEILIKNGELPASAAAEPLSLDDLDPDLMEVDTDWLDSLALSPPPSNLSSHRTDPLIGDPGSPFDLFIDDPDLKVSADWSDRIDFAI